MAPAGLHFRETRGSVRERSVLEPQEALLAAGLLGGVVGAPHGGKGVRAQGQQGQGSEASDPRLGRWKPREGPGL